MVPSDASTYIFQLWEVASKVTSHRESVVATESLTALRCSTLAIATSDLSSDVAGGKSDTNDGATYVYAEYASLQRAE